MLKKTVILIISILLFISFVSVKTYAKEQNPLAISNKVSLVVFIRQGCVHCEEEQRFIADLSGKRQDITISRYSLEIPQERKVWENFTEQAGISKVTPITVIGNRFIVGFDKPETTGKEIIQLIDLAKKNNIKTDLTKITKEDGQSLNATCDEQGLIPCSVKPIYDINLPFLGRVNTQKYPLLILSGLLGFFDGFNPCAMWVLISFLMILLQVRSKKKMLLFAGTFIFAEAIMYAFILVVWHKTWDFVQLDNIVTPIIGIVSIIGGALFLKEWRKKELACKVTNFQQRKRLQEKISFIVTNKFTIFTLFSILGIAFSVNIIEFACSIGIPQTFTKILELNKLSLMENGFYIAIYILFYMIDDLVVFGIALYGIDKLALTTKYSKISNLIGGIVMILLGLILLFKPHIVLF